MKILSLFIVLIIAAGCSDSNTATTSTSSGSTGDFIGTMQLTDHRGRSMADGSGVTVQIEGTSLSAVSDASGNWVIHNVPTGNYAIKFSKANFYTRRNPSYSFIGGSAPARYKDPYVNTGSGAIQPVPLGEIAQFTIILDAVTMPTMTEKIESLHKKTVSYIAGKVFAHTSDNAPDSVDIGVYLLVGKKTDLRIEDASSYLALIFATGRTYATTDSIVNLSTNLDYPTLQSYGIQPGDVVYFKAYPVIGYVYQFNQITNKIERFGNGPTASNTLSATFQ